MPPKAAAGEVWPEGCGVAAKPALFHRIWVIRRQDTAILPEKRGMSGAVWQETVKKGKKPRLNIRRGASGSALGPER
jgi:hypothetical protein